MKPDEKKPSWWPKNPYPEDIFPMKRSEYSKIVPDDKTRTALSGCLGRMFWDIASDAILDALKFHLENMEYEVNEESEDEVLKLVKGILT
jgi:hypothetical protein